VPIPSAPAIDETFTIAPLAFVSSGAQARIIWKAPIRFTA
jgi:hypothetical protein